MPEESAIRGIAPEQVETREEKLERDQVRSSEAPHTPGWAGKGQKNEQNPQTSAKNHARKQTRSRLQESNSTPPVTQAERNEALSAVLVNQVGRECR